MTHSNPVNLEEIEVEESRLNLKQPLGRFLILLFRQFEDELIAELNQLGYQSVSASDLNVIRNVDPKGISAVRIAELAGVTKQAISKQIDKLEAEGIVSRQNHANDQRVKLIAFTKKGEKLVYDAIAIIQRIESRYAHILGGNDQLNQLKSSLRSLMTKK